MRGSLKVLASANQARVHRAGLYCTVLFLFLMASALCAFGQEATIVGTVTDPSGASVAGASVTLTDRETGQEHHFLTSGQGEYVAPDIHIGHYTVRVEATGFKAEERKDITLQVGDRARVDFQMQVGTTKETVTVEATAVAVQADTSEISQVVSGDQLEHLGTNGRSMYTFLNLTTGASNLQGDGQTPTSVGGDASVSFNGNRTVHNLFMMDGGEDDDRGGGGTFSIMPSIEGLGEFRTLTSNYDAEYGLSSAATMTTVMKSGTSKLHGSAWEYFRNDALDANNYFFKKSELRYNIFGANVGGPIDFWKKQHKSFFFYNQEWRRFVYGGSVNHDVPANYLVPGCDHSGIRGASRRYQLFPHTRSLLPSYLRTARAAGFRMELMATQSLRVPVRRQRDSRLHDCPERYGTAGRGYLPGKQCRGYQRKPSVYRRFQRSNLRTGGDGPD